MKAYLNKPTIRNVWQHLKIIHIDTYNKSKN